MADKHTKECKKHKAIFGSVGCTCHGTGEKKLDSPREKIRQILHEEGCLCYMPEYENSVADQILALIEPLIGQRVYDETRRQRDKRKALREWCYKKIEDAREQEGRRIIDAMYAISAQTLEASQYRAMVVKEILKEE